MIKAYFLDVKTNTIKPLLLDPIHLLEGLYRNIGTDMVALVRPTTGNFVMWVDEEGLLKKNQIPFAFDLQTYVGNAVFTSVEEDQDIQVSIERVSGHLLPTPMVIHA